LNAIRIEAIIIKLMDITSRSNAKIKLIKSLRQRKYREQERAFLVEGIRQVGEAYSAGAKIQFVLYDSENLNSDYEKELIQKIKTSQIPLYSTLPDIMLSIGEKKHSSRMIAVVENNIHTIAELEPDQYNWIVALDAPQDPGNVGTILRTIDAVGADALVLLGNHVDPTHPSAIRASMGVMFRIPIFSGDFDTFIKIINPAFSIVGTSAKAGEFAVHAKYPKKLVLLMGSEREGLSDAQKEVCDQFIKLPMEGTASSLNLSVATGVILYQIYHQRHGK
jgi:TrmH family RNA methyltransferase